MSNDINYIGPINAEWVDPKVEWPPDGWHGPVLICQEVEAVTIYTNQRKWFDGWFSAWLRVGGPSDTIPRAQVQAAVDALRGAAEYDRSKGEYEDRPYLVALADGIDEALDIMAYHTGVTPKEAE